MRYVVVAAALLLAGCSDSGVPWGDYSPVVKTNIDRAAAEKDCTALQGQFDLADANGDAEMARTGHNNAELMKYVDGLMRKAGCY